MKDIIVVRIDELIHEINVLLEQRERLSSQIKNIESDITAKKGAIFEFKNILELKESCGPIEEQNQERL
jgi:hypothetical protein